MPTGRSMWAQSQTSCCTILHHACLPRLAHRPEPQTKLTCNKSTQLKLMFTPPRQTRQDCRACLSTAAAATQARQAATPNRPTVHTQRRRTPWNCKHAVDCCIWLNLNFFTKRHSTRVIYRLTVQTLPDRLETQFTPPDTTQTALSGGQCELGITRRVHWSRASASWLDWLQRN